MRSFDGVVIRDEQQEGSTATLCTMISECQDHENDDTERGRRNTRVLLALVSIIIGLVVAVLWSTVSTTLPSKPSDFQVACSWIGVDDLTICRSTTSIIATPEFSFGPTIPTQLGLLTQLVELDLFEHALSGAIPSDLGKLTQLVTLNLALNNVMGTIPTQLGLLPQLTTLQLWESGVTGTIPTQLGMLTQLNELPLYGNRLTGTIPTDCSLELQIWILVTPLH